MVATDQYDGVIGMLEYQTTVDFTKLYENKEYQELVKDLGKYLTINLSTEMFNIPNFSFN